MNNFMHRFGNMQNFVTQFNQFRQNFGKHENPQAMVQQLLDSGRMTQGQFNQLSQMANQILGNNNHRKGV